MKQEDYINIIKLGHKGLTSKEIAGIVGISLPDFYSAIARLKKEGIEVPYNRHSAIGREAKFNFDELRKLSSQLEYGVAE